MYFNDAMCRNNRTINCNKTLPTPSKAPLPCRVTAPAQAKMSKNPTRTFEITYQTRALDSAELHQGGSDPDPDDFQNIKGTSLSKDSSIIKFS